MTTVALPMTEPLRAFLLARAPTPDAAASRRSPSPVAPPADAHRAAAATDALHSQQASLAHAPPQQPLSRTPTTVSAVAPAPRATASAAAVLHELDRWLARHDAYVDTSVKTHLDAVERAEVAQLLRQRNAEAAEASAAAARLDGGFEEMRTSLAAEMHEATGAPPPPPPEHGRTGAWAPEPLPRRRRLRPAGFMSPAVAEELRAAGKHVTAVVREWRDDTRAVVPGNEAAGAAHRAAAASALPSDAFCERAAEHLLVALFDSVATEVDGLCDDLVDRLVEHELDV